MKTVPFLSFDVDKDNRKITVNREFASQKPLVWKAWTTAEILDQWWAPKPWKAVTESMDFSVGGRWIYYMLGPEGEKHWSFAEYKDIEPQDRFSAIDGFCDENKNINQDMPQTFWNVNFEDKGGATMVRIYLTYDKLEDLEKILEMGFQEGFTMGLGNLDEVLEAM